MNNDIVVISQIYVSIFEKEKKQERVEHTGRHEYKLLLSSVKAATS